MAAPTQRTLVPALALAIAAGSSGCGLVPRSKLDECHKLSQTLRAENGRLKDVTLGLRTQNQDLSQRAVDDARRLSAQDEAIERLEKSVVAYQKERDELTAAFDEMRRQVRLSVGPRPSDAATAASGDPGPSAAADPGPESVPGAEMPPPAEVAAAGPSGPADAPESPPDPLPAVASAPVADGDGADPLRAFAEAHASTGWTFDPETGALSAGASALFEPGSARLTDAGASALGELARALRDRLEAGDSVELVGRAEARDTSVRRAAIGEAEDGDGPTADGPPASASSRFLAAARGALARDRLIALGGLDPGRVRLVAPAVGDGAEGRGAALRVRLAPSAGLDAPAAGPR